MNGQSSKAMRVDEVWQVIQAGNFDSYRNDIPSSQHEASLSLKDAFDQLCREPATAGLNNELEGYLKGSYREVLRRLERLESPSLSAVLLKVLCLLQMAARDELIGTVPPTEYLRDKVLTSLKQVEHIDDSGKVRLGREWLERLCLGYELPADFWEQSAG